MAKTGSERTQDWRDELKRQGYRQKAMLLPPKTLKDIDRVRKRYGLKSDAEAVAKALADLLNA